MSRLLALMVLCFVGVTSLSAQQSLVGHVTDSEGAAISMARVLIHWDPSGSMTGLRDNVGTKQDAIVFTGSDGSYSTEIPSGLYDVFISSAMFTPSAAKLWVGRGRTVTFSVKLKVDSVASKAIGGMEVQGVPPKQ
jgi:Carboxypeptidase regulatory-like domain